MTSPNCTGAPLSWLVMEQYHLGELPQTDRERVRRHLEFCPGCAQCMDSIENSSVQLKPLPDIPVGIKAGIAREWKWLVSVGALTATSVLLFVLVGPFTTQTITVPPASMGYKGGDLAIGLTRYRHGAASENPLRYVNGDAFGVRVTCPPIGNMQWDVIVFQGSDVFFPYDNRQPLHCGNTVSLDGEFELSGNSDTTICITVEKSIDREQLRDDAKDEGIGALPDSTVCTTVRPGN
ncbi:MAG: zf-HC2 domain-containing protein [Deltaproteobacteria bacterium]|nr:zf-HC2 domain-containing protein [Deltaproteobacteria bacterium]